MVSEGQLGNSDLLQHAHTREAKVGFGQAQEVKQPRQNASSDGQRLCWVLTLSARPAAYAVTVRDIFVVLHGALRRLCCCTC